MALTGGGRMTNELEKQFFDTFGIEPRLKTFAIQKDEQGELTYPPIYEYPQITDRILLELICILNENTTLDETYYQGASTVKELKKLVLKDLIKTKDNFDTIHQVRTLFEEG